MTRDSRTLLVPGTAALCCASAVLLGVAWLAPPSLWTDTRVSVRLLLPALLLSAYLACGALGAWWSRRAGGGAVARLAAGIFPLTLHAVMVAAATTVAIFGNERLELAHISFQRVAVAFIVLPGIALAIGALPFLRDRADTRVSA